MGADYTISTGTTTFDGDTDCGGICTSADTIIIAGGARGSLRLRDINGNGTYIVIKNEDTTRVVITESEYWTGVLYIDNCKYIDLRGDNLAAHSWEWATTAEVGYGIKVVVDGGYGVGETAWTPTAIKIEGESHHVKIGYIEVDFTEAAGTGEGSGIQIGGGLDSDYTFDTFEIHHNYIHDTGYAGMYLGNNCPPVGTGSCASDDPYVANFSIHDNLLEDLGAYGITYKGVPTGSTANYIYNNIVRGSNRASGSSTGLETDKGDSYKHGIGVAYFYNTSYASIYNNWVEKTVGQGLKIREASHLIYDNVVLGCGTGNGEDTSHGITVRDFSGTGVSSRTVQIYDNIIIESTQYGVYVTDADETAYMQRNIIAESGSGESSGAGLTEGSGSDANIYYASVSDFEFNTWSDDDDYSNDIFRSRGLTPESGGTGVAVNPALTWTNFAAITGISMYYECGDSSPDVLVIDDNLQSSYSATAPIDSTCYWQIIHHTTGQADITGAIYSFATTSGPPVEESNLSIMKYSSGGGAVEYSSGGMVIK